MILMMAGITSMTMLPYLHILQYSCSHLMLQNHLWQ